MGRIYYSKLCDPNEWPKCKIYWFPFAESLIRTKYGLIAIMAYVWLRMKLEGIK